MLVTLLASEVLFGSRMAACFIANEPLRPRVKSLETQVSVAGRTSSI